MKRLFGVLLVVAGILGILLAAEVLVRSVIVNQAAAAISEPLGVDPEIEIQGQFVLPQVLGGRLEQVDAHVEELEYAGINAVDVRGSVTGIETRSPYLTDTLSISARITTEELNRLYNDVSFVGGEITTADGAVGLEGYVFLQTLGITFNLDVVDNAIRLTPAEAYLNRERIDLSLLAGLLADWEREIRIPIDLPDGIRLGSAEVRDDGVVVTINGAQVALADLEP